MTLSPLRTHSEALTPGQGASSLYFQDLSNGLLALPSSCYLLSTKHQPDAEISAHHLLPNTSSPGTPGLSVLCLWATDILLSNVIRYCNRALCSRKPAPRPVPSTFRRSRLLESLRSGLGSDAARLYMSDTGHIASLHVHIMGMAMPFGLDAVQIPRSKVTLNSSSRDICSFSLYPHPLPKRFLSHPEWTQDVAF